MTNRRHASGSPANDVPVETDVDETPVDELHQLSRNEIAADERHMEAEAGLEATIDNVIRGIGRRIYTMAPQYERPLRRLRSRYATAYVHLARLQYGILRQAPIDPFRVAFVSPDAIVHVSEPMRLSRFRRVGIVADGDWDRSDIKFTETDIYHAFRKRFQDGVAWEETPFFARIAAEIDAGDTPWGCASESALMDRCRKLDELYAALDEHGVLSQRELVERVQDPPLDRNRETLAARIINDEIAVDIGRDGELLYADGRNRLAMAKLLNIEEIPVLILRRHRQWADVRDAVATFSAAGGSVPKHLRSHPDLESIIVE